MNTPIGAKEPKSTVVPAQSKIAALNFIGISLRD